MVTGGNLFSCDFRGTTFKEACLNDWYFYDTDLRQCLFDPSSPHNVEFEEVNITNADMTHKALSVLAKMSKVIIDPFAPPKLSTNPVTVSSNTESKKKRNREPSIGKPFVHTAVASLLCSDPKLLEAYL
jgi:hypothetical protein